jgi:hypothetical protein
MKSLVEKLSGSEQPGEHTKEPIDLSLPADEQSEQKLHARVWC